MVGPIQACCYIITLEQDNQSLVIDPGGDGELIIDYLKTNKLKPKYLVNTHGHIDHIGANFDIKKAFPDIEICIHRNDEEMLKNAAKNLSVELGFKFTSPPAGRLLENDDLVSVGRLNFKILHTPGHTPGGICLLSQPFNPAGSPLRANLAVGGQTPVIFTGDTLFEMGIGRTDFPGSSHEDLINSIQTRIFTLPDETIVYPGHGGPTTVGQEKHSNPFFS